MNTNNPNDSLVLSYLDLRKAVGIIGMALPFVLVFGKLVLQGGGIEASISGYYYTAMRDVLVGSLCSIGVFLGTYRGYARTDSIAGNLACVFALGTALFPTNPENPSAQQIATGNLHAFFAAALFLILAFFALVLFRKTDPTKPPTPQKIKRNRVYTACGYIILTCIALVIALKFLPANAPIFQLAPIFWLEAVAIFSFGVSWLVKGEAILKDNFYGT